MDDKRSSRGGAKRVRNLPETGATALVLGALLLILPAWVFGLGASEALVGATRVAGWAAVALGAALLALHLLIGRDRDEPSGHTEPEWASQLPVGLLRRSHGGFDQTDTPPITRTMAPERSRRLPREPDAKH